MTEKAAKAKEKSTRPGSRGGARSGRDAGTGGTGLDYVTGHAGGAGSGHRGRSSGALGEGLGAGKTAGELVPSLGSAVRDRGAAPPMPIPIATFNI